MGDEREVIEIRMDVCTKQIQKFHANKRYPILGKTSDTGKVSYKVFKEPDYYEGMYKWKVNAPHLVFFIDGVVEFERTIEFDEELISNDGNTANFPLYEGIYSELLPCKGSVIIDGTEIETKFSYDSISEEKLASVFWLLEGGVDIHGKYHPDELYEIVPHVVTFHYYFDISPTLGETYFIPKVNTKGLKPYENVMSWAEKFKENPNKLLDYFYPVLVWDRRKGLPPIDFSQSLYPWEHDNNFFTKKSNATRNTPDETVRDYLALVLYPKENIEEVFISNKPKNYAINEGENLLLRYEGSGPIDYYSIGLKVFFNLNIRKSLYYSQFNLDIEINFEFFVLHFNPSLIAIQNEKGLKEKTEEDIFIAEIMVKEKGGGIKIYENGNFNFHYVSWNDYEKRHNKKVVNKDRELGEDDTKAELKPFMHPEREKMMKVLNRGVEVIAIKKEGNK